MKVQITVDDELWRKAKAHAAMNGVTLGEVVGEALGMITAQVLWRPHKSEKNPPTPSTPPKQAGVGAPVTDEEVPEKRCFKCKSKVRVWAMTEKGPLCPDCKSQMEVSIP